MIGAGNFATRMLLPALKDTGAELAVICSSAGLSAAYAGRKFGFRQASTDIDEVLQRESVNTALIVTRHDTHAELVCKALQAGKHVFVEKPLAITLEELQKIEEAYRNGNSRLMVGFNRRFAPHAIDIHQALSRLGQPKSFIYTINAGAIPSYHWTRDPKVGGGRIIGEACHFIDLLRYLVGAAITDVRNSRLADDTTTISLTFADGSIGAIHYFTHGHRSFPKERLEVFCGGRVLQLDNFRRLRAFGWPLLKARRLWRQDKGHRACIAAFIEAVKTGGPSPIPFDEIIEVSRVTIEAAA